MNLIVENWFILVAALCITVMSIWVVVDFNRQPKEKQIEQVREWLLYACTMAEAQLGSGSGQLKLRLCYDWFLERFPALGKVVTFAWFSGMVDETLVIMREMLENNQAIKAIVEGESE